MKTKLALALAAGVFAGFYVSQLRLSHEIAAPWKNEKIARFDVDREMELLRAQFGDEQKWRAALRANHLWNWELRREMEDHMRGRVWLDRQLHLEVSEQECREYFAQHSSQFMQPTRYHVAHLFAAAPAGSPNELMEMKKATAEDWAQRLASGEEFVDLAAQLSEDEATKKRGGDLGWFSDARMPADFIAAVRALRVGATSTVVQTRLGFHILRLIEMKPTRMLSFEEAHQEIILQLQNARRGEEVAKIIVDLASGAPVVQSH